MRILYFGPLWDGSTARHRASGLGELEGIEAIAVDDLARDLPAPSIYERLRWKVRVPVDRAGENARLIVAAKKSRPDAVIIDSSQAIEPGTLQRLRALGVRALCYYSPDDAVARHSLSRQLRRCLPEWDVFFTTKTFNIAELRDLGARNPVLIGKAYDSQHHRPLTRDEVGEDYERFDAVFVGAFEQERADSVAALAKANVDVIVFGANIGWAGKGLEDLVTLRDAALADEYGRAMHTGRLALCFLRKASRDRITQRSVEIPAMARPMLAEHSDEHNAAFRPHVEYEPFANDEELIASAKALLADDERSAALAQAGYRRCMASDYSTLGRARQMVAAIEAVLERDPADAEREIVS